MSEYLLQAGALAEADPWGALTPQRGMIAPAGMVARWTLDDVSAGYVDLIGGLTLAPTGTAPTTAAGVIGNAASFGGAGRLLTPDTAVLRVAPGFACECWLRPSVVTGAYGVLAKYNFGGVQDEWGLLQNAQTTIFRVWSAALAMTSIASGNVLAANTWTHAVGAVHSDLTLRLYINGSLANTSAALSGLSAPATRLSVAIGDLPNAAAPFTGRIDEPAIWQFGAGGDPGVSYWLSRYNAGAGVRP